MDDIISIRAAKTHLSQLIARVEAGEVITIARGKTPVATWRQSSATANENSGQCGGVQYRIGIPRALPNDELDLWEQ